MKYPTEILNNLELSLPPLYNLQLESGVIVIFLRDLNPYQGLLNGTRTCQEHVGYLLKCGNYSC